ncbi:hypothetical protein G6N05_05235 [Flavobacterium sp. F372]|uniref:HTH luxR-type domain-containing protein n=1 Tax=Flavobacterium bernardetii TaxID=2813823 RepID=A0ABR7J184_9FLAO|nr:LuxR C-terminal-related transcriptional regulator [Flavobacterium bernardetii]MBC5835783.1 hypothetical protein [Flavobacterium bernardetii]NHF69514.1 hypothetical protein [Flavobacterium bernardetii]
MTNIQIPSGLLDNNVELFSHNGEAMATHEGRVKFLFELPIHILDTIQADLEDNPSAGLALELAGYTSKAEKLNKYTTCRFGSFDTAPDFKDGQLANSEHFNCGYRGSCPMEGVVCGSILINGRTISPFEVRMIEMLATERTLLVIAEDLKISMNTFETRKKVLYQKLKVLSRPKLVAVAYEKGILTAPACSA